MNTSKVIKSIRVNTASWKLVTETSACLVFSNGAGWCFVRISTKCGGGYKLLNKAQGVEMKWEEGDAIGSQLWGPLCNQMLGL